MTASLQHVHPGTPMGATLVADGATFRVWAPNAREVHVLGDFNNHQRNDASLLTRDEHGHWRGFIRGARDRQRYMFHVVGGGSEGPKRDPYARELQTPFPSECIIRSADFPWHDRGFVTPSFHDFVIYQLHVGTFFTPNLPGKGGTFLDVACKLPYLAALGVTALQLMPIQEFQTTFSLGYNGTDYFSPEMDFAVDDAALPPYAQTVNRLLDAKGAAPYRVEDLHGEMNQLKALVDLAHLHGLAVILDLVYNHAGGDFGDESLYFFDRQRTEDRLDEPLPSGVAGRVRLIISLGEDEPSDQEWLHAATQGGAFDFLNAPGRIATPFATASRSMTRGKVVLVPFPFDDLATQKARPGSLPHRAGDFASPHRAGLRDQSPTRRAARHRYRARSAGSGLRPDRPPSSVDDQDSSPAHGRIQRNQAGAGQPVAKSACTRCRCRASTIRR